MRETITYPALFATIEHRDRNQCPYLANEVGGILYRNKVYAKSLCMTVGDSVYHECFMLQHVKQLITYRSGIQLESIRATSEMQKNSIEIYSCGDNYPAPYREFINKSDALIRISERILRAAE